jgi:hypothetical protein
MPNRPRPVHQSTLFAALLAPASGYDLDPRDLEKITTPTGHTASGFRDAVRRVAAQAREAFDEGRQADARNIVRAFCEQYAGELEPATMPGSAVDYDAMSPDQLAEHVGRR